MYTRLQYSNSYIDSQNTNFLLGGIDWGAIKIPTPGSSTQQTNIPQVREQQQRNAGQESPENIRQLLLADPHQLSLVKERNPRLAEAINNPEEFAKVIW